MENEKIDIFVDWVDGTDQEWIKEKESYFKSIMGTELESVNDSRFRPNIDMRYWFRAIEKNMPWVNKIFFVTNGQEPDFINKQHTKIKMVRHDSFIPPKYLPTFNSNTIEMNAFRIEEMSENFILFNDDVLPIRSISEQYFFKNNKVCDEAIERIFAPRMNEGILNSIEYCKYNNMALINKHFKKREVQKKNFTKWYNLKYGKELLRNISLAYYYDFDMFSNRHLANAMKKSTFKKIWDLEYEICDKASQNKFRNYSDVSQYLVRGWQICEGDFYPRRTKGKSFVISDDNYLDIAKVIRKQKYPFICLNDSCYIKKYDDVMKTINEALEYLFPEKSSFEK